MYLVDRCFEAGQVHATTYFFEEALVIQGALYYKIPQLNLAQDENDIIHGQLILHFPS